MTQKAQTTAVAQPGWSLSTAQPGWSLSTAADWQTLYSSSPTAETRRISRPWTSPEGSRPPAEDARQTVRQQAQEQPELARSDSSPVLERPTQWRRRHQVAPGGAIAREDRSRAMYNWQREMGAGQWAANQLGPTLSSEVDSSFGTRVSNVTMRAPVAATFGTEARDTCARVHLGGKPTSYVAGAKRDDRTAVHACAPHGSERHPSTRS